MKRKIYVIIALILVFTLYVTFKLNLNDITGILILFGLSLFMMMMFMFIGQAYRLFLLLSTIVSDGLFILSIYLSETAPEPANFGDISLLPLLLFWISAPIVLLLHIYMLYRIFTFDVLKPASRVN